MSIRLTEQDLTNYIINSIPGVSVRSINIQKMMTVNGDVYVIRTGIKFWNNPSVDYIVLNTYVDSMLDYEEVSEAVVENIQNCLRKFQGLL